MTRSSPHWNVQDARDLYGIPHWGKGYFRINDRGAVEATPLKTVLPAIDLERLVDRLRDEGLELPLLIRFTDILKHRLEELNLAFARAIEENEYSGSYCSVYPIKVNQQRQVVEDLVACSAHLPFGLECGSKPELLAVLALAPRGDMPIICNGFKDSDFIEMVVLAQKLGKRVIPVVEKSGELDLILEYSDRHKVRPQFGVRTKLSARGAGRWKLSTGDRSKFGLTVTELLDVMTELRERNIEDSLKLLHFHIGSQITNIYNIKNAITEAARVYVELTRAGAGLEYLDVGGGLGVDYDGSQTNFESSVNYSLGEYAGDVISRVQSVCDEANIAHPTIVTEAGRAMVAYHSVLVTNVLDVSRSRHRARASAETSQAIEDPGEDAAQPLRDLYGLLGGVTRRNIIECYHDAVQYYEDAISTFNLGYLSLEQRGLAERIYAQVVQKILRLVRTLDRVPEELEGLEDLLADTYFCNFSVFQSLPDTWAIDQIFPIMPIHRHREEPTRRGVLADVTCDSDGKVDRFIDLRDVKKTLELHGPNGADYYLGVFLVGAYQEILGDLHNLFGDTNSVHVALEDPESASSEIRVEAVVKGDTVAEVLSYVQYSADELVYSIRRTVRAALREKKITPREAKQFVSSYEQGLSAYTYLSPTHDDEKADTAAEPPKDEAGLSVELAADADVGQNGSGARGDLSIPHRMPIVPSDGPAS